MSSSADKRDFRIAFAEIFPFWISVDGRELMRFFNFGNLANRVDETTSKMTTMPMGMIACMRGMDGSVMGSAAISEISRVVTKSENSNSPICRFPIRRMARIRRVYIRTVRMQSVVNVFTSGCVMVLLFVQSSKNIHFSQTHLTKRTKGGKIVKLSGRTDTTDRSRAKVEKNI